MINVQTLKSATNSDNILYCGAEQFDTQFVSGELGAKNVKCIPYTQNYCTIANVEATNDDCLLSLIEQ